MDIAWVPQACTRRRRGELLRFPGLHQQGRSGDGSGAERHAVSTIHHQGQKTGGLVSRGLLSAGPFWNFPVHKVFMSIGDLAAKYVRYVKEKQVLGIKDVATSNGTVFHEYVAKVFRRRVSECFGISKPPWGPGIISDDFLDHGPALEPWTVHLTLVKYLKKWSTIYGLNMPKYHVKSVTIVFYSWYCSSNHHQASKRWFLGSLADLSRNIYMYTYTHTL